MSFIKLTSRDYESILSDIENNPNTVNAPIWFKDLIAGLGNHSSQLINVVAQEFSLETVQSRQQAKELLLDLDYQLREANTSTGIMIYYLKNTTSFPITVTKQQLKSRLTRQFEGRQNVLVSQVTDNFVYSGTDNILTVSTDFEYTGHKLILSSTGTLPAPLQINTPYYIIYVSDTEIKLSESIDDAFDGIAINITDYGTGTHSLEQFSFHTQVWQQESKTNITLERTTAIAYERLLLPEQYIIAETLEVYVNTIQYNQVFDNFWINAISTDKKYKYIVRSENQSSIEFGNDTYGEIPSSDSEVIVNYAIGGGIESNVNTLNTITNYTGGNINIEGCSNATRIDGGLDLEPLSTAIQNARILIRTQERFLDEDSGRALILKNYPEIKNAFVEGNFFGILSSRVFCVLAGGGNPSSTILQEIEDLLTEKSILEGIAVYVIEWIPVVPSINISVKMRNGCLFTECKPFIEFAIRLYFSETAQEIIDLYNSQTDYIDRVNFIFGTAWTSIDKTQIDILLNILEPSTPGQTFQISDLYGYLERIITIDYLIINTAFPFTIDPEELTTHTGFTPTVQEII